MVKMKQTPGSVIFNVVNTVILLAISLLTLYPFAYLLMVSFSPIEEFMKSTVFPLHTNFTLESYQYVFHHSQLLNGYGVTIIITVGGTLLNLALSALGAYVLSQKQVFGRRLFTTMIIITMVFNGGLIPNYLLVKSLHLTDTLWALILPCGINTFWMIIMRNFFAGIPTSLSESARIDGCSEYGILFRIILPLSGPVMASLALFYGVQHWNEYFNAIIYINKDTLMPLQVLVRQMYQSSSAVISSDAMPAPVETTRAATVMVATLPILCLYPFLQKYFVKGMMVGAVKG